MVRKVIAIAALGTATALAASARAQGAPPAPGAAQPAPGAAPPAPGAAQPAPGAAPGQPAAPDQPAAPPQPGPAPTEPGAAAPTPTEPAPIPAPAAPAPAPAPPVKRTPVSIAPPKPHRLKPLQMTTGKMPTDQDLGSEADMIGVGDSDEDRTNTLNVWTLRIAGYIRAPIRIGFGPRNDDTPGTEWHTPPRIVGLSSGKWDYISLAPNPSASLYLTYGNPLVSANVIFGANTLTDGGYPNLDHVGGINQAYITLKSPAMFGTRGGMALTAGAFSLRYGNAGPRGTSSGHYGTYLFGRTHVMGELLSANIDLTSSLQLIVEHGVGAKLEQVPYIFNSLDQAPADRTQRSLPQGGPPTNDFLPSNGKGPPGSNFLQHAHAGIALEDWFKFNVHYLTSWTPNDNSTITSRNSPEGRITVMGAEIHVDDDVLGNGFLGYSHVKGENLLAVADALQVVHGSDGRGLKEDYFGGKDRLLNYTPTNAWGTVDTVMLEYLNGLSAVTDQPLGLRDIKLGVYSMFSHAQSDVRDTDDPLQLKIDRNMLKYGAELDFILPQYLVVGFRADRVTPDIDNTDDAYTALSPRLIVYSKPKSREYIVINYTHFFLGPKAYPGSPYSDLLKADPDMIMVAAIMSFKP
jgi:hypothetical protein